jgi:ankyrin repeat protein
MQGIEGGMPHLLFPWFEVHCPRVLSPLQALHWCAAKGHVHCVQWLLQQEVLQVSTLLNQADATALHTAAEHGQAVCAQLLVVRAGADVQQLDGLGQSAVQAAASAGHQALAQQLLLWELVMQMAGTDR